MDAGPIWASRTFALNPDVPRKSTLYNGPVTDAAVALMHEVVAKATDPGFVPEPLDYTRPGVRGRAPAPGPPADRGFDWSDPTEHVLRRIRAADGAPGVHTRLCGTSVAVFDAHRGRVGPAARAAEPGAVVARRHGAVLVRTGDGAIWIGHRPRRQAGHKLPATTVLADHLADVPEAEDDAGYREIGYGRDGPVGILDFRFYNGAMSTGQCRRLLAALRHATAQDTRVLLLRGGRLLQRHPSGRHRRRAAPAAEAWDNIVAIDDVCEKIITCVDQLVVCSMAGNAGAGGVMLALGADRVVLRAAAVLNPHYRTMGLYGSEYWTYVLPRRVGDRTARSLTTDCVPVGARARGPHRPGRPGLARRPRRIRAHGRAAGPPPGCHRRLPALVAGKRDRRAADEQRKPLRSLPPRGAGRDQRRHLRGPPRLRRGAPRIHHQASHPPYRRYHAVKRPHPPCVSA